jgi:hypothetical protein
LTLVVPAFDPPVCLHGRTDSLGNLVALRKIFLDPEPTVTIYSSPTPIRTARRL